MSARRDDVADAQVHALLRSKSGLAFAQLLCAAPEGGIRVVLGQLDDMRFRVVEQFMGADARRIIALSAALGQCRDELHWTVDGNHFAIASTWREPSRADWLAIGKQQREEQANA